MVRPNPHAMARTNLNDMVRTNPCDTVRTNPCDTVRTDPHDTERTNLDDMDSDLELMAPYQLDEKDPSPRIPSGTICGNKNKHQYDWYDLEVESDTTYGDPEKLTYT